MPVLHISITKPKQTVKLSNHVVAQDVRFKKASILNRHTSAGTQGILGNLEIHFDGLMGNEILSNKSAGRIVIPNMKHYNADQLITNHIDYDLAFNTENIPREFVVETFGYYASSGKTSLQNLDEGNIQRLPSTPDGFFATQTGEGMPMLIDLFFDYETNNTYF